ncbi:MAG: hypothetical protein ACC641_08435 [Acidiferrobacterales bacterium]
MKLKNSFIALVYGTVLLASSAYALEVDREVLPRITLGGRLISTVDSDQSINIGDSSFATRFDKRLYENGVAGGVIGIKEDGGVINFNQTHVFFWNRDIEAKAGRTRLPNTFIEFPLLRDEDMMSMTHVGNGSSNSEYDQFYGKIVSFDWVLDQKVQKLGVWTGTRRNDVIGAVDGFDSYGASFRYEQPESLRYLKRVRRAGILLDAQKDWSGSNEVFQSLIAGAEFNLNINPKSNWSMGAQAILNAGVPGVTLVNLNNATNAVSNRARGKSTAFVTSLRYTRRPHLLTRLQAAVTVGYKSYDAGGSEVSVAPSLVYRVGQGIDLLAQYRNTQFSGGLNAIGSTNLVQVGLAFDLDAKYNDTIGVRDSILNLEHGYIQ